MRISLSTIRYWMYMTLAPKDGSSKLRRVGHASPSRSLKQGIETFCLFAGYTIGPRVSHCAVRGSAKVNGQMQHQIFVYGGKCSRTTTSEITRKALRGEVAFDSLRRSCCQDGQLPYCQVWKLQFLTAASANLVKSDLYSVTSRSLFYRR